MRTSQPLGENQPTIIILTFSTIGLVLSLIIKYLAVSIFVATLIWGLCLYLYISKTGKDWVKHILWGLSLGFLLGIFALYQMEESEIKRREYVEQYEKTQEEARLLKEKKIQEDLANLPNLVTQLKELMGTGQWEKARLLYTEIYRINSKEPILVGAYEEIKKQLNLIKIQEALTQAQEVVDDSSECKDASSVADAWDKIQLIDNTHKDYNKAKSLVARLENCRKNLEKGYGKDIKALRIEQRQRMAETLEETLLDDRIDARVKTSGTDSTKITITWILMSRLTARDMIEAGNLLVNFEKAGFKKATFSDGYSGSIYYDLEPEVESTAGKDAMEEFGLGDPLRLP